MYVWCRYCHKIFIFVKRIIIEFKERLKLYTSATLWILNQIWKKQIYLNTNWHGTFVYSYFPRLLTNVWAHKLSNFCLSFCYFQISTAYHICTSALLTSSNAVHITGHESYEVWRKKPKTDICFHVMLCLKTLIVTTVQIRKWSWKIKILRVREFYFE